MNELLLLIPCFFCILLLWRIYKTRTFDQICFIFAIWLVVSVFGYLYTTTSILYEGKGPTTFWGVAYLIMMYAITMFPMLNSKKTGKYVFTNFTLITYATYILAIAAYLPFIENLTHLSSGGVMSTLGDNYDLRENSYFDVRAHMSWLGARLNSVTLLCKYITPLLLINYLFCNKRKKMWVIIGLTLGAANPAICMLNMGSRWVAIEDTFFFIFLYLVFSRTLSSKIRKYILIGFGLIFSFLAIGLLYITIGRFEDTNFDLYEWYYRYIGEGFCNFTTDMWYCQNTSDGMHLFRGLYDNAIHRLNYLMGIRMYVFYTFVGDLYADLGIFGCVLCCLGLGILGKNLFSYKHLTLYRFFACSMYCKVFITGFTYIVYINTHTALLIASSFFYICYLLEKADKVATTNKRTELHTC